jgi:hypothetical protein
VILVEGLSEAKRRALYGMGDIPVECGPWPSLILICHLNCMLMTLTLRGKSVLGHSKRNAK